MRTHDAVTIGKAALSLGIGARRLRQLMRERHLITKNASGCDVATLPYVKAGYLRNEHRSHRLPGTHIDHWYTVALVTGHGMALLQELINAVAAHGPVVVEERHRPHRERGPDRRPLALQRLGATPEDTRSPPRHR